MTNDKKTQNTKVLQLCLDKKFVQEIKKLDR